MRGSVYGLVRNDKSRTWCDDCPRLRQKTRWNDKPFRKRPQVRRRRAARAPECLPLVGAIRLGRRQSGVGLAPGGECGIHPADLRASDLYPVPIHVSLAIGAAEQNRHRPLR